MKDPTNAAGPLVLEREDFPRGARGCACRGTGAHLHLLEAAAGASRAKHSALQARFRRVLRLRGPKKAVVAVAHALLRMVYHVLADGTVYHEVGADYYDRHHRQRVTRRALQTLERQGYRVTLEPAA